MQSEQSCIRGKIRNRDYASQIRDFSGLRFENITPTDIDGHIDYKNKLSIWFEAKHGDAPLPYGQRLAFERICDDIQRGGKPCIFFIATHNTSGDIAFTDVEVREYRWHGQWHQCTGKLRERIMELLKSYT